MPALTGDPLALSGAHLKYSPDQPRDDHGRFGSGGGGDVPSRGEALARMEQVNAIAADLVARGQGTNDLYKMEIVPLGGQASSGYTPERQAQHEAIIDGIMARNADVPNDRQAIILGGLPGAGKTYAIDNLPPEAAKAIGGSIDRSQYLTVNPDDMKAELVARGMVPDYPGLKGMEASALIHEESSDLGKMLAARAMAEGKNVIFDGTLGNAGSVRTRMEQLDKAGYAPPVGIFVHVNDKAATDGAVDRFARGMVSPEGPRAVAPDFLEMVKTGASFPNRSNFDSITPRMGSYVVLDNSVKGQPPTVLSAGSNGISKALVKYSEDQPRAANGAAHGGTVKVAFFTDEAGIVHPIRDSDGYSEEGGGGGQESAPEPPAPRDVLRLEPGRYRVDSNAGKIELATYGGVPDDKNRDNAARMLQTVAALSDRYPTVAAETAKIGGLRISVLSPDNVTMMGGSDSSVAFVMAKDVGGRDVGMARPDIFVAGGQYGWTRSEGLTAEERQSIDTGHVDHGGRFTVATPTFSPTPEGVVAHEFGHMHDFTTNGPGASTAAFKEILGASDAGGLAARYMSEYGRTSPYEAYAEAFAGYHLTNGETSNPVIQAYATRFGWNASGLTTKGFTALKYSDEQPRDADGRFGSGGEALADNGAGWRSGLSESDERVIGAWEQDKGGAVRLIQANPKSVEGQQFGDLVRSAPKVDGPVYRGVEESKGGYILSQDKSAEQWEGRIGQSVRFNTPASTSADPTVASGFGHTLFKLEGADAHLIGNGLHEAVAMPGTYTVTAVEKATVAVGYSTVGGRLSQPYDSPKVIITLRYDAPSPWRTGTGSQARVKAVSAAARPRFVARSDDPLAGYEILDEPLTARKSLRAE